MIQYGLNTFVWSSPFQTKDLHFLDHGKALGLDLVEIPIESIGDLDFAAGAEAYARTGLACSICAVMGAGRDPSHPDEKIQQAGIDYLDALIDGAATMGGKMVAGPLYSAVGRQWQQTPEMRKEDLARTAKNLRISADYAEKQGVCLALEPLNRFETSFINLTEQALELVELIGSPAVGLMMDTFHANIEEKHLGKAHRDGGRQAVARPRQRERPRHPRHRARRLAGGRRRAEEDQLQRRAGHRILQHRGQGDRPRRGRLAPAGPHDRQPGGGWHGVLEEVDGVSWRLGTG